MLYSVSISKHGCCSFFFFFFPGSFMVLYLADIFLLLHIDWTIFNNYSLPWYLTTEWSKPPRCFQDLVPSTWENNNLFVKALSLSGASSFYWVGPGIQVVFPLFINLWKLRFRLLLFIFTLFSTRKQLKFALLQSRWVVEHFCSCSGTLGRGGRKY